MPAQLYNLYTIIYQLYNICIKWEFTKCVGTKCKANFLNKKIKYYKA